MAKKIVKKKPLPRVNPKPAAKVDEAAKVLLAPKPPPPFKSAEPRPIEKPRSSSNLWLALFFLILVGIAFGLFIHFS